MSKVNNFRIKTPHAAVIVWNYVDRIVAPKDSSDPMATGVTELHTIETHGDEDQVVPAIISTLSCISIQTSKSKSAPDGTFQLVLAPFKNWVSTLTPGSWCCLLMSSSPISEKDLTIKANPKHVKMIGKIESVRCETQMLDDGSRRTLYYVSGVDWGHIFNSQLYVDNLLASANDPQTLGNAVAIAIRNASFVDGTPHSFSVRYNLQSIMGLFGKKLGGFSDQSKVVGRLANSIYDFNMPQVMVKYFGFIADDGEITTSTIINSFLVLKTGSLVKEDTESSDGYEDFKESAGYLNPFSLQGSHSVWQILLENSNTALNEMFCDIKWTNKGPQLTLYNRIRPFSYKNFNPSSGSSKTIDSFFQNVRRHKIDGVSVVSVNAGTNWRDKFNFIEIKPQFQDFKVMDKWYTRKVQAFDSTAFEREGFRPLIVNTKQFPIALKGNDGGISINVNADWDQFRTWVTLLRDWHFDTHRLLNGTIVIQGQEEYIGVGDNIEFDAGLINPTPNINKETMLAGKNKKILAHVESIAHSFTVSDSGARTFRTTINFVRGIVLDGNEISTLDASAIEISSRKDRNHVNVISTSDTQDPDPQKVRGT